MDTDGNLVAASVETEPRFRVGDRRTLFRLGNEYVGRGSFEAAYDVTADDQRFLMVRRAGSGEASETRMILVENWLEELKAKVGRQEAVMSDRGIGEVLTLDHHFTVAGFSAAA